MNIYSINQIIIMKTKKSNNLFELIKLGDTH